jgi:hypothetical protein
MVQYESTHVKARGLETDKENIENDNKVGKKRRKGDGDKVSTRQPLEPITDKIQKKSNVLQEISINN